MITQEILDAVIAVSKILNGPELCGPIQEGK